MRIEWRSQGLQKVDRLSPGIAVLRPKLASVWRKLRASCTSEAGDSIRDCTYEAFPCHRVLILGPRHDLQTLRFGEFWVIVRTETVTTPLVIVISRNDPQGDRLNVLPILETEVAKPPQCFWTCKDKAIVRPRMELGDAEGRGRFK